MNDNITHARLLNFWKTNPNAHLGGWLGLPARSVARLRADGRVPLPLLARFVRALRSDFGIEVTVGDLKQADSHARWLELYKHYADFAKAMGVAHTTARWWRERGRLDPTGRPMGRIPVSYWPRFIQLLKSEFGFVVTTDELAAAYQAAGEDTRREAA